MEIIKNVKKTFFPYGCWVSEAPEMLSFAVKHSWQYKTSLIGTYLCLLFY